MSLSSITCIGRDARVRSVRCIVHSVVRCACIGFDAARLNRNCGCCLSSVVPNPILPDPTRPSRPRGGANERLQEIHETRVFDAIHGMLTLPNKEDFSLFNLLFWGWGEKMALAFFDALCDGELPCNLVRRPVTPVKLIFRVVSPDICSTSQYLFALFETKSRYYFVFSA